MLLGVAACKMDEKEQQTTKSEQQTPAVPEETTTKATEETTTKAPEEVTTRPPADLPPTYDQSGFPNDPSGDDETKRY